MNSKLIGFLGLTRKSGKITLGGNLTENAINKNKVKLIILCEDASENTKEKFTAFSRNKNIKLINFTNKEDLGKALGKSELSVVGITDAKMADVISDLSDESLLK